MDQLKNYIDLLDVALEDKKDIDQNMSIYRNNSSDDRVYRLSKETNGES
jgi:hypothetical protein